MYRIIGSDGKEYGPVSAQQLREWIAQGRVNAQTQVLLEGTTEWRPLSDFPEFMTGAQPATPSAAPLPATASAMLSGATAVSGPATGLIVTAILGFIAQLGSLAAHFAGLGMGMMEQAQHQSAAFPPALTMMMSGTFAVVSGIIGVLVSGVILFGGLKMKKLESYPLAIAASILAAVPCLSPCCVIGLPIGIWALVVLFKPEVKEAFNQNS